MTEVEISDEREKQVLKFIDNGSKVSNQDVCDKIDVGPSTAHNILNSLENKDLIRDKNPFPNKTEYVVRENVDVKVERELEKIMNYSMAIYIMQTVFMIFVTSFTMAWYSIPLATAIFAGFVIGTLPKFAYDLRKVLDQNSLYTVKAELKETE